MKNNTTFKEMISTMIFTAIFWMIGTITAVIMFNEKPLCTLALVAFIVVLSLPSLWKGTELLNKWLKEED